MSCKDCDSACVGDYKCPDEEKSQEQNRAKLIKIDGLVFDELRRAAKKFGPFKTPDEGWASIDEEG